MNMNGAKLNLQIELDGDGYQQTIRNMIDDQMRKSCENITRNLFKTPKQRQEMSEWGRKHSPDDMNTIGMMYDNIIEKVDAYINSQKFEEFAANYIEQNFENHLKAALNLAMSHKANAIAFQQVKVTKG